jgi:hypothetical protein
MKIMAFIDLLFYKALIIRKCFSPKLEKGKRGRCYIDRRVDQFQTRCGPLS